MPKHKIYFSSVTKENIPDSDLLYYRVHKTEIRDGEVIPGAFRERGEGEERGMPTNWNKYSTAKDLKDSSKNPIDNAIIQLTVSKVRAIESLLVLHAPVPTNRSYSHVIGIPKGAQLTTKVRAKLQQIYEWSIQLDEKE